jgi:RNA polymerase sigma-70 factor, ECF subfamily
MEIVDGDVTILLQAMTNGDASAAEKAIPLVYKELHRLARSHMGRERSDHTLQPTALINEAYLRVVHDPIDWKNRQHFIAVVANLMRRILVDHARTRHAKKRGSSLKQVDLNEEVVIRRQDSNELLALHEALNRLEKLNARQAKVVELRYFAGLSVEEIGEILSVSQRTVKRDWALARLWLFKEVQKSCLLSVSDG